MTACCTTILSIQGEIEDRNAISLARSIWPPADMDRDPGPAVAALMKLSFDDHSRQPICALGRFLVELSYHSMI